MNAALPDRHTLYRTILAFGGIALIVWGAVVVMAPFMPALIWAIILCLTTWPAFTWIKNQMGGHKNLAALSMTLLLAVCFILPLFFLGSSLAENFSSLYHLALQVVKEHPAHPPQWVLDMPVIGADIDAIWQQYWGDPDRIATTISAYADPVSKSLIVLGAAIGKGLLDLSLGVLIAFFFFRDGSAFAKRLSTFITRFVGYRGQHLLDVSKRTMIGVVYGILGASLAQGTAAGIGFWIAGVPGAPLLGILTLVLSFIPMGPPLIWIPAAAWLYSEDHIGLAIFLALWGLIVISMIDNIIRPYFISLGSSLPLLLVLLGVFGGIFAFGFVGLFIGPTILALAHTLIVEWSHSDDQFQATSLPPAA